MASIFCGHICDQSKAPGTRDVKAGMMFKIYQSCADLVGMHSCHKKHQLFLE